MDDFIKNIILESKINATSYSTDSYTLKWTLANETKPGLVFLCIYSKSLQLPWVNNLLELAKTRFIKQHGKKLTVDNCPVTFDFESIMHKAMGVKQVNNIVIVNHVDQAITLSKRKNKNITVITWWKLKTKKKRKSTNTTTNGSPMKHKPSFVIELTTSKDRIG